MVYKWILYQPFLRTPAFDLKFDDIQRREGIPEPIQDQISLASYSGIEISQIYDDNTGCSEKNRLCSETWPTVNIQDKSKSFHKILFWRTGSTSAKEHFWRVTKTMYFNWSKNAPKTALFKTLKRDILEPDIDYKKYNEICKKSVQDL